MKPPSATNPRSSSKPNSANPKPSERTQTKALSLKSSVSAEGGSSILSRQCLDRRIPDIGTLAAEAEAWTRNRNKKCVKADWQFTTDDARVKLKRLYPQFP